MLILIAAARPALADATAFIGSAPAPEGGSVRGAALAISLSVVGFEFEYSETRPDSAGGGIMTRSGMLNVLVETPGRAGGVRFYATFGGGVYHERPGSAETTNAGGNAGGGVKIPLLGPFRLRLDYRAFRLRGSARRGPSQRFYAGVNLRF